MGVAQYKLGEKHALRGYRRMCHRSKSYDSRSAQLSYDNGFSDGLRKKYPNQYPASPQAAPTGQQAATVPANHLAPRVQAVHTPQALFQGLFPACTTVKRWVGNNP
jgi:hypothetical protein